MIPTISQPGQEPISNTDQYNDNDDHHHISKQIDEQNDNNKQHHSPDSDDCKYFLFLNLHK